MKLTQQQIDAIKNNCHAVDIKIKKPTISKIDEDTDIEIKDDNEVPSFESVADYVRYKNEHPERFRNTTFEEDDVDDRIAFDVTSLFRKPFERHNNSNNSNITIAPVHRNFNTSPRMKRIDNSITHTVDYIDYNQQNEVEEDDVNIGSIVKNLNNSIHEQSVNADLFLPQKHKKGSSNVDEIFGQAFKGW